MQDALGFTPLQAGLGFLPMTLINVGVALAIPRLRTRVPDALLLAAGVLLTLAGMAWLSRAGLGDPYLTSIALPMVLVGAGQGLAFAPLTTAGIAGVDPAGAGAASGLLKHRPPARHGARAGGAAGRIHQRQHSAASALPAVRAAT